MRRSRAYEMIDVTDKPFQSVYQSTFIFYSAVSDAHDTCPLQSLMSVTSVVRGGVTNWGLGPVFYPQTSTVLFSTCLTKLEAYKLWKRSVFHETPQVIFVHPKKLPNVLKCRKKQMLKSAKPETFLLCAQMITICRGSILSSVQLRKSFRKICQTFWVLRQVQKFHKEP